MSLVAAFYWNSVICDKFERFNFPRQYTATATCLRCGLKSYTSFVENLHKLFSDIYAVRFFYVHGVHIPTPRICFSIHPFAQ